MDITYRTTCDGAYVADAESMAEADQAATRHAMGGLDWQRVAKQDDAEAPLFVARANGAVYRIVPRRTA